MARRKRGTAAGRAQPAKKAPTRTAAPVQTGPPGALPGALGRAAAARASGQVRRKNLNVDQGLLDQARALLGVKTETEAVALGLGAVLELAAFRAELLAGFDDLMRVGGLGRVEDEESDFSGFAAEPTGAAR